MGGPVKTLPQTSESLNALHVITPINASTSATIILIISTRIKPHQSLPNLAPQRRLSIEMSVVTTPRSICNPVDNDSAPAMSTSHIVVYRAQVRGCPYLLTGYTSQKGGHNPHPFPYSPKYLGGRALFSQSTACFSFPLHCNSRLRPALAACLRPVQINSLKIAETIALNDVKGWREHRVREKQKRQPPRQGFPFSWRPVPPRRFAAARSKAARVIKKEGKKDREGESCF